MRSDTPRSTAPVSVPDFSRHMHSSANCIHYKLTNTGVCMCVYVQQAQILLEDLLETYTNFAVPSLSFVSSPFQFSRLYFPGNLMCRWYCIHIHPRVYVCMHLVYACHAFCVHVLEFAHVCVCYVVYMCACVYARIIYLCMRTWRNDVMGRIDTNVRMYILHA